MQRFLTQYCPFLLVIDQPTICRIKLVSSRGKRGNHRNENVWLCPTKTTFVLQDSCILHDEKGNTVIIVEQDSNVTAIANHVIDLGPSGGV